ncbi:MAG: energy-coupling factor ABC transporter permease [Clostridiales bacterium]|jgi:cobalt/nickel transport system permease protein|nr:energy-coupling factor ABC transporter permease [Clostridiales bacterium]
MHLGDALISPAVGGVMIAAGAGAVLLAAWKTTKRDETPVSSAAVMGVMGAFVFAAQMLNFAIPGTGSSGHVTGAVLLAALLGPYAAVVTLSIILAIQCLMFADGGLLAIGCNIFNMAVLPCLAAFPLMSAKASDSPGKAAARTILACAAGAEMGALAVTVETYASGIVDAPFWLFLSLMMGIHLAIGAAEGAITAAVLAFIRGRRPCLIWSEGSGKAAWPKKLAALGLVAALVMGGLLSPFASGDPDGLEWSFDRAGISAEESGGVPAPMPDYGVSGLDPALGAGLSGIAGTLTAMGLAAGAGLIAYAVSRRRNRGNAGAL